MQEVPVGQPVAGSRSSSAAVLLDTPLGRLVVRFNDAGLQGLAVAGPDDRPTEPPRTLPDWIAVPLQSYWAGDPGPLSAVPLDLDGTPFQLRVWEALRTVGPGDTTTYGELAQMIGSTGAARAIGGAVGRNPVLVAVPCHRVIAGDGTLGGYSAGPDRKQWLLTHEGVEVSDSPG
jgi:methylated-DNA-[protein]-cysteine S-methyltransferase